MHHVTTGSFLSKLPTCVEKSDNNSQWTTVYSYIYRLFTHRFMRTEY